MILSNGLVCMEGSDKIFATSPNQAEAKALLRAATCVPVQFKEITFKTDSRVIVKAILSQDAAPSDIRTIIADFILEARRFNFCKVIKVHRNCISKAHKLATNARKWA